jgi:tetratricopeptide (TPR) repeat protein
MLLPVLGVSQVGSQAAADRYTYLPSVGIFLLAGAGVSQRVATFAGRKNILAAGVLVVSLICIALGQLTVKQIAIWQDSETLWTYVIKHFPGRVPSAHNNLGVLYDGRGLHDKALEEYEKAVAINPTFADAHSNLGVAYKRKGAYDKAIKEYEKALAGNPNLTEARNNLGLAYYEQGMYDKAVEEYEKALAINPALAETRYNLGLVYYFQGMVDKAVEEYEKAIAINPAFAVAHYKLGLTYYEKNNFAQAKIHIERAQNLGYEVDAKIAELIRQAP